MKITDILVSTLVKHGVIGEMKNFKTEVEIPAQDEPVKLIITADVLQIRIDKD